MEPILSNNKEQILEVMKTIKCKDKIELICVQCNVIFRTTKSRLIRSFSPSRNTNIIFCSNSCSCQSRKTAKTLNCGNCGTTITRELKELKKSKSGLAFCSKKCSYLYNFPRKKRGARRSKIEMFLEKMIKEVFSYVNFITNDRTAITSELDFYFPDLRLAIEINGIVHYEPIYGEDTFNRIVDNDKQKIIRCYEKGIELIIIPTLQNHYTKKQKEALWSEVEKIIKNRTTPAN